MKSLDMTYKLFSPEKAIDVAKELADGDPNWDYIVRHDPKGTGYSFIDIMDENGEFVAKV